MLSGSRAVFLSFKRERKRGSEMRSTRIYTWKDNRLSDCQSVCLVGHTFAERQMKGETDVEVPWLVNLQMGWLITPFDRSFTWWWICSRLFFIPDILSCTRKRILLLSLITRIHTMYVHVFLIMIYKSNSYSFILIRQWEAKRCKNN